LSGRRPARARARRWGSIGRWAVQVALLACLLSPSPALAADDAWAVLADYRTRLAAESPWNAVFVQTFVPEGFSTGEEESGRLALSLPECMRWDYDEPYPKSFLLCGDVFHYWNEGEDEGRIEVIEAEREPGLDLLLVEIEELKRRYAARLLAEGDGPRVELTPLQPNDYVAQATLHLDSAIERLEVLRYVDPEGNVTEFRISSWRHEVPVGTFNPPRGIEWLEEY
jgi:outer membrane lipoprotein-sorting protein